MATWINQSEARFFGYVQSKGQPVIRSGEVAEALRLTREQETRLLSRLARHKRIARVRRGLYLVPARFPAGGAWSPSEALAITTLMEDRNGRYQISGPNAFSRYGWDEQIPSSTFAYNNRISGNRVIGSVGLTLVKVTDARLGATDVLRTPEGIRLIYASKPRALMDAVYDWSRFRSLPRAYEWIRSELTKDESLASELVSVTLRYGNQGTLRRIGKLLQTAKVQESLLRKIEKALRPTSSFIAWIPSVRKVGVIDKRWKVVVNG